MFRFFRLRIIPVIVLSLITSPVIFAQNWFIYSTPRSRQLHDISFQTQTNIVVVGGHPFNDSITYTGFSNSSGKQWSLVLDLYPGKMQTSVLFTSVQSGISAGVNESLYKTANGGQTWTAYSYGISLNKRNTNSLFKATGSTIFSAGGINNQQGFILKSDNNGNTWQKLHEWSENEISDGAYVKPGYLSVCGPDGFLQYTTDNGINWTESVSEMPDFTPDLKAIIFINDSTGYCAGGKTGEDSVSLILRTTNCGINWSIIYNETGSCLNAIEKVTSDILYAAGDYGIILKSADAGLTWTKQDITVNPGQDIFAIDFYDEHLGGFSARWGNVLIYNDGYHNNIDGIFLPQTGFYPNPVSDILHFNDELSNVTVYDINGNEVKYYAGPHTEIDVSFINPGTYFIKSDNYRTFKVIIK